MTPRYVVVDGSNIATEGRSIPSLAQLDEAVRAFMAEHPDDQVIVVVDASFGYRIDESERREYEQAEAAGEIVSPPAGAIGRGDGFLLRIADRTNATVLSNDSFQEFHGEYPWLFETGRLVGGKPVPGVGWIFTLRTPVRGPRSREATRAADKARRADLKRAKVADGAVAEAIAEATAEVIDPKQDGEEPEPAAKVSRRGRRRRSKPAGTVNDPLPFIEFIAEHPLGSEVEGEVDGFTSHGAFVLAGSARCYVPLVALGDPPPRSAKEVLTKGERRTFVVQALDPPRRGIELALPELARVAGTPTEETVEADIGVGRRPRKGKKAAAAEPVPATVAATSEALVEPVPSEPVTEPPAAAKRARRSRKKAPAEPVEATAGVAPAAPEEPQPEAVPAATARRTRKKAVAQPAREGVPTEPVPEDLAPPPVKARRSRKKAVAEPAPEAVAAAVGEAAAEAATPRSAKARRSRKKAVGEPEPGPAVEPAPAAAAAKAKRSRKKAVAEPQPASAVEPSSGPAAESPTKARRTGRRAATEPEPQAQDPRAGAAPVGARPRRRRASTDQAEDVPAATPAEEARPRQAPTDAPPSRRRGTGAVALQEAEQPPAPAVSPASRRRRAPVASEAPASDSSEADVPGGPRRSPARVKKAAEKSARAESNQARPMQRRKLSGPG
jgi:hypothetical protein